MKETAYEVLKLLVSVKTENPSGNEEALADCILDWLRPWNPHYEKVFIDEGRCSLLLWLEGEKEEYIGIAGHLDTVPAGKAALWKHPPFGAVRKGSTVYGRGTADMKGGLASMLLLYLHYRQKSRRPPCGILFIFTADEEAEGRGMKKLCDEHKLDGLRALIECEPTDNQLGIGELGTLWLKLSTGGIGCHASMSETGVNALEEGLQIIDEFRSEWEKKCYEHPFWGKESCSLTQIRGGLKVNMIPEAAEFYLDIRTVPENSLSRWGHEEMVQLAEEICEERMKQVKGLTADIEVLTNRMAVGMKADSNFIKRLQTSAERARKPVQCISIRYFTDVSILFQAMQIPFVIMGPGKPEECHRANEKTELSQIEEAVQYYRIFIEEISKTEGDVNGL